MAVTGAPDLIVLDLGLPDRDGKDVLRDIRAFSQTPVIVLSARDRESEKIEALDLGADDYVEKPFGIGELTARLRAALRHKARRGASRRRGSRSTGVALDFERRLVTRDGAPVKLTPKEYELLAILVSQCGTRRDPSPDPVRRLGAGAYRGYAISARLHRPAAAPRSNAIRRRRKSSRPSRASATALPRHKAPRVAGCMTDEQFCGAARPQFRRSLPEFRCQRRWHARCVTWPRLLRGQAATAPRQGRIPRGHPCR